LYDDFSNVKSPRDKNKLKRPYEKSLSNKLFPKPVTEFEVDGTLYLTNLHGTILNRKKYYLDEKDVTELIKRCNCRDSGYYLDRGLWEVLCRAERGKVSNKLRLKIYQRDGERCVKCGGKTNLEIDHIIPISKGGESTIENLQTLCHYCNTKKGANIDWL
jgi:CRISPR/Cas system Type II protein with McrA/HNH and RuvC-like nuclease domain